MDGVASYVEWAHKSGFGIIDANVPHYITHPEDIDAFTAGADEKTLSAQIKELMNYIWDNYLQLYDAEDLFLLGVGNAYLGVKFLLTERRKHSATWSKTSIYGHANESGRLQGPNIGRC